ncbi:hypothetical protein ACIRF8_35580 [Streptomyces sp. NPDC102406]|uniref:hypothetical protein n=1 Tax=Streptomyces sp. NPDC102406 TaxID=3366171 RepID=UPI0038081B66
MSGADRTRERRKARAKATITDTTTTDTTAARPVPGWGTAAGILALARPSSPSDEHGGPVLDRLLITERIARYGWAYDERDQAALAGCFTADDTWQASLMGERETPLHQGAEAP